MREAFAFVVIAFSALHCTPRPIRLTPPWSPDRAAVLVFSDSRGNVQPGSPLLLTSSASAAYFDLRGLSDLVVYAETFDATVATSFAACGMTLTGTQSAPPPLALYASDPFDAGGVSAIDVHTVASLPITVRYQRACGPPSVCQQAKIDVWPLAGIPIGSVLPFSDDVALAMTFHPDSSTLDHLLRLDWSAKTIVTSTLTLATGLSLVRFHGHAIASSVDGNAFELDSEFRVFAHRRYGLALTAFDVAPDGTVLLATYLGCAGLYSVQRGTWSSTAVDLVDCNSMIINHVASGGRDWNAYATQDVVKVNSGTTAARDLVTPANYTALAISPSLLVAGPRVMDWSVLARGSSEWTSISKPFGAVGRIATIGRNGSILAGGDGGAFSVYSNGSWCSLSLPMRMAVYGLGIAPSGRTAFIAMWNNTDGALLRLSLPSDL
jgi:hypothetical protein